MDLLEGMKTVLITGANRGIGLGLAKGFREAGDYVLATARRPYQAKDLIELRTAQEADDHLRIHALDLGDPASIDSLATELTAFPGKLDLLINNAGIYPDKDIERLADLNPDLIEQALRVNLLGTVRLTRALLPLLEKSREAKIINMSSGASSISTKENSRHYAYGLSKAALNFFTRGLAAELKPQGIPVVAISPGWVRTEMGGEDADLTVEESTAAMLATLANLGMEQSGLFLDRHGRTDVYAW